MGQQPSFSQAGMTFPQGLAGISGQAFSPMSQQGAPLILPPTPTTAINPYILQQGKNFTRRQAKICVFSTIFNLCNVFTFIVTGLSLPGLNAMNAYLATGGRHMPMMPGAPQQNQSAEMTIPNELIGCIIGRGGAKINEIRYGI